MMETVVQLWSTHCTDLALVEDYRIVESGHDELMQGQLDSILYLQWMTFLVNVVVSGLEIVQHFFFVLMYDAYSSKGFPQDQLQRS